MVGIYVFCILLAYEALNNIITHRNVFGSDWKYGKRKINFHRLVVMVFIV